MKIIKIGKWSEEGYPIGWVINTSGADIFFDNNSFGFMQLGKDGSVSIGGVEVAEWSEARREAMGIVVEGKPEAPKKERKPREKKALGKGIEEPKQETGKDNKTTEKDPFAD